MEGIPFIWVDTLSLIIQEDLEAMKTCASNAETRLVMEQMLEIASMLVFHRGEGPPNC